MEWSPPGGILGQLVAAAERRAASLEATISDLERSTGAPAAVPSLGAALFGDDVALIAEIKRASPSRGAISPDLDAPAQAMAYERGGASSISVLTEPDRFGGRNDDLRVVADATSLPILKKDFHVAASQIFQARALGASAALLIARAIAPAVLRELMRVANGIGLEIVVEVRDLPELERALAFGARLIGVNNRNLETLAIEPATTASIIPEIPRDCIAIAESGYSDRESIVAAAACGADAVLVGSFLSAASNPETAVRRLTGVRRIKRGR